MMNELDSFSRQADLVPPTRLLALGATVIGVGAIGRQVALQLASLGTPRLQLIDFDTVEVTNVITQGFRHADVGQAKVAAVADAIRQINPLAEIHTVEDRFRPRMALQQVVFCCVDSIVARSVIWRSAAPRIKFWADGRMLGEVMRLLVVADEQGRAHYPTTIFSSNAAQGGSCTAHSTIYAATIAAGLLLHQFTRWLRGLPIDVDTSINLLAGDWAVMG